MAAAALRWILDQPSISCVIPGFKNRQQINENLKALEEKPFNTEELQRLRTFYEEKVKNAIRGPY